MDYELSINHDIATHRQAWYEGYMYSEKESWETIQKKGQVALQSCLQKTSHHCDDHGTQDGAPSNCTGAVGLGILPLAGALELAGTLELAGGATGERVVITGGAAGVVGTAGAEGTAVTGGT